MLLGQLVFYLFYRIVNLDEGWYLWASKLVYEGQLLYRDFAYTQTPLLPFVYGVFQPLWGQGLYQGRLITIVFSTLALLLYARTAQRHIQTVYPTANSRWVNVVCLALFASSFYTTAYLSYTATYGLASLWLSLSLLFALPPISTSQGASTTLNPRERSAFIRAALATTFLCMAIATRLSVLGAAPALALYLIMRSRARWRPVGVIALSALAATLILIGPFLWLSAPQMLYDIFGFHTDRILSAQRQLTKMGGVLQRTASTYAAPLLILLLGLLGLMRNAIRQRQWPPLFSRYLFEVMLVGMTLGMLLLHLLPRTTDDYYNTLLGPLWAVLGASLLARFAHVLTAAGYRKIWGLLLAMLAVVLNGVMHAHTTIRADLVQFPPQNQIAIVKAAADFLRDAGLENKTLLTLNTHLALEANMTVPSGYEMSIFSYRPTWSNEQAQRYKAVNNEILIRDLAAGAAAMAITDFDLERFYGERQRIFEAMWRHYRFAKIVPGFDPMRRNLYIYLAPRFTPLTPQFPLAVELANGVTLLGYDLDKSAYLPGEKLYLGLYWQAPESALKPYTVFVHIVDSQGRLATNWDTPPCSTTCPTDTWLPHENLRDPYQILLPADWDPGVYTLMIGMYDSATGVAVALPANAPQSEGQRLILGQFQVLPR
ncbi:MAG: hypothetical protein R2911_20225 [Caldilineaceae bacterium]